MTAFDTGYAKYLISGDRNRNLHGFHLEHASIRRLDSRGAKGAHESIAEDNMNRILELQLLQVDTATQNETNETNYSTCSHSACSTANGDGFEDL